MRVEGIDKFESAQLHYRVRNPDQFKDKRVAVFGAGDSAFDWALELAPIAKSLTLVHRSDQFRAAPASVDKFRALATAGDVDIIEFGTASGFVADDGRLTGVEVQVKNGEARVLEIDHVLAFFGLAPKLGPIAEWGLDIRKKTIDVNPEDFQTNIPGIFAIGDICQYPGKKKLILSGFHEAALAAFAAKAIVEPGRKVHLQYTTTSPIMHKRLGIDDE
jgi:thioredoxin reductase (NADPH)